MKRIKRLAADHPLTFSVVMTLILILMVIISSVVASAIGPGETSGWYLASTAGRLVTVIILLVFLSLMGWLGPAGFTRLGNWRAWLVCLLALLYIIPASAYAMTRNLSFGSTDLALTGAAAVFIMIHAFLEEVVFRGLVLYAMISAWGSTKTGITKSVLVSSLLFGCYHLFYLLGGEPFMMVLLRMVVAFLLGIFLAALVLLGSSIYPAVLFHGLLNLAGYLNLTSSGNQENVTGWLFLSLAMLPLAVLGFYLLRDVPRHSSAPQPVRPVRGSVP